MLRVLLRTNVDLLIASISGAAERNYRKPSKLLLATICFKVTATEWPTCAITNTHAQIGLSPSAHSEVCLLFISSKCHTNNNYLDVTHYRQVNDNWIITCEFLIKSNIRSILSVWFFLSRSWHSTLIRHYSIQKMCITVWEAVYSTSFAQLLHSGAKGEVQWLVGALWPLKNINRLKTFYFYRTPLEEN